MTNAVSILDERLSPEQVRILRRASDASARHGVELFLVGGTVRDLLLGRPMVDLDLSIEGGTPEFASAVARELEGEVAARSQFGTAKLKVGDSVIDLAAARKESYAHPGALPTVAPGTIQEDLARRDFTINAMAVSVARASWGHLLDPFDGRRDLGSGLIRVLHPGSFRDDATRILRAVRYAQRLRFRLEAATERLLREHSSYLDAIKGDRVRHELERIFLEENAADMLAAARDLGVLSAIHPALRIGDSLLAKLRQIRGEPAEDGVLLSLALLAYSVPSGDRPGLVARLAMDARWARVVRDIGSVRDALPTLRTADLRPSQVHELLRPFDGAAISGCALAAEERLVARRLELYQTQLRHVKTALNGDDLIALGVPRGPMLGKLLGELLSARLDGKLASREEEERFVARRLRSELR